MLEFNSQRVPTWRTGIQNSNLEDRHLECVSSILRESHLGGPAFRIRIWRTGTWNLRGPALGISEDRHLEFDFGGPAFGILAWWSTVIQNLTMVQHNHHGTTVTMALLSFIVSTHNPVLDNAMSFCPCVGVTSCYFLFSQYNQSHFTYVAYAH